MGVFTFVCRESGGDWSAKQINGDLQATADGTYDLERKLVQAALEAGSSGAIQSSFSYVTPSSAVFQVTVGGGVYVVAGSAGGGGGGAAAEAPAEEEKKEEVKEESDDEAMFSLFD